MVQFNMNWYFVRILNGNMVLKSSREVNLYYLNYKKVYRIEVAVLAEFTSNQDKLSIWHCCLGYLNMRYFH